MRVSIDGRLFRSFFVLVFALAGSIYAPVARAAFSGLLNVDFGETSPTFNAIPSLTYSGAAVIGSAGDVWNGPQSLFAFTGHQSASGISLLDSTGAATAVTLGYDITGGYNSGAGTSPFDATTLAPLMRDYIYDRTDTAAPGSVTLSGLTANGAYDLYLYSASDGPKETLFTVNGVNKVASSLGSNPATLTEGVNYLKYSGTADAAGDLTILFTANGTSFDGVFSGLQLATTPSRGPAGNPVPLPPALFVGIAGAGLAWPMRRWVKK